MSVITTPLKRATLLSWRPETREKGLKRRFEHLFVRIIYSNSGPIICSNGDRSPNYLYSSSKVFTGAGTRQVGISIESGNEPVKVDQLKIAMTDPDQNETYIEKFQDVEFTFEE